MNKELILEQMNVLLQEGLGIENEVDGGEEILDIMADYDLEEQHVGQLARGLSRIFRIALSGEDVLNSGTVSDLVELIIERMEA